MHIPFWGIYQIRYHKFTKGPQKYHVAVICLFQMAIKYLYQYFPFKGPPKYDKIGTFGMRIYHLATLHWTTYPKKNLLPRGLFF
jgi:hypothetical protein